MTEVNQEIVNLKMMVMGLGDVAIWFMKNRYYKDAGEVIEAIRILNRVSTNYTLDKPKD